MGITEKDLAGFGTLGAMAFNTGRTCKADYGQL